MIHNPDDPRVKKTRKGLHGEQDTLLPIAHGEKLFEASTGNPKRTVRIRGAGHNDILMTGIDRYFEAIAEFTKVTS